ncbi:MAG TPA: hypothetical protein VJS12_04950 [Steroidobacteraceae bacterium]|nr:hypothetical protein [Steroidobacteraceae bacterium]
MRTLLDLLNDERAYVRIYKDLDGFGYEVSTYAQEPVGDLFARMNGYDSMANVREAAQQQLSAAGQVKRRRRRRARS